MNQERDLDDQSHREPLNDQEARGMERLLRVINFMDEEPDSEMLDNFIANLK